MSAQVIPIAATPAFPAFWFEDTRARAIIGQIAESNAADIDVHSTSVLATYANQYEQGRYFSGDLIDELTAIRTAALDPFEQALDWDDRASIDLWRTQAQSVHDVLLAALHWRPNGGGMHDPGLAAHFAEDFEDEGCAA